MTPDEQRKALWEGRAYQLFKDIEAEIERTMPSSSVTEFNRSELINLTRDTFIQAFTAGAQFERTRNQPSADPLRSEPETPP